MAHNLTNGHPTEKDHIQPFTVMVEEPSFRESGTPSPSRGGDTQAFRRLRIKSAMTVSSEKLYCIGIIKNKQICNKQVTLE